MPYFFDTNIIIGYLFSENDTHGKRSRQRIEDKEENHTGNTTYEECFGTPRKAGKALRILKEIKTELLLIQDEITQNGLITFRQKFNPDHYKRTGKFIQTYLNDTHLSDPVKESEIRELIQIIEEKYLYKKQKILNPAVCTWHPKRPEPYLTLQKTLAEKIENTNDIEVLLDTHHAAQKISGLVIVTADKNDILNNKTSLLQTLPTIKDIIYR